MGSIRLTYHTQDVDSGCDRPATKSNDEIEITPEMIEAGEEAVLSQVGGADLGGFFSAAALAKKVYLAMAAVSLSKRHRSRARNRKA